MHLLGHNLPDHKLLRVALTSFYGLSHSLTPRLLARLQIPTSSKVSDLTENQITSLSAFLSSPSTTPKPPATPLQQVQVHGEGSGSVNTGKGKGKDLGSGTGTGTGTGSGNGTRILDPLDGLRIETDLKRDIQGDIAHLRQVGAYRGRRHALGLPVRGQKTRNNAQTAKKLNRVERRRYGTFAGSTSASASASSGSGSGFGGSSIWTLAARAFRL